MNRDKVLGYVSALIDGYVNKEERARKSSEKRNLLIIIEDLNNLKGFIEEAALEGQTQEQPRKFIPEDSNGKHY
ncbi:hypothetical protein [Clostridium akagii]|uniref:hypothetical protein n=1 Tax=Clostridium akagii TaxID=91623 RepID=UPI00047C09A0|nr:hypothetical protein [Clostridium akagii]